MQTEIVKVIDRKLIICRPRAAMQHPATLGFLPYGGPFTAKYSHFVSVDFSEISQIMCWTRLNDFATTQLYGFDSNEITALLILLIV